MRLPSTAYESANKKAGFPIQPRVSEAYSVEVSVRGSNIREELKVWHKSSSYMCLLAKENSDIHLRLKAGDNLRMKYYAADVLCPSEELEARVRRIKRKKEGKLKGQYLAELEILKTYH